jgi:hypothetical protein
MDDEEFEGISALGQAFATMTLQNSVDAINAVFGPGKAKMDSPLLAAVFTAQSHFISNLMTAASMVDDDPFAGIEEAEEFEIN